MENSLTFAEIEDVISKNPALDDLEDSRDFILGEIMGEDEKLPSRFSLRPEMTPVKSQGSRGTCVGFAGTAIDEFFNAKEYKDSNLNLSEEYLFMRIKEFDVKDYNHYGYGAYLRSAAKALTEYGTCLESSAPYNYQGAEDAWKTFKIEPKMNIEAEKYKMKSYARVIRNEEAIKRALVQTKTPLLAGVTLYDSYRQAKKNGGKIPIPKKNLEEVIGGHAMEIVGYNETHIEFKNSWGSAWGDEGYIWWPWEALDSVYYGIWSFIDIINDPQVIEDELIEQNKEFLKPHQVEAWNKAIKKGGLINSGTLPNHQMTKGDFFVFLDRLKLL